MNQTGISHLVRVTDVAEKISETPMETLGEISALGYDGLANQIQELKTVIEWSETQKRPPNEALLDRREVMLGEMSPDSASIAAGVHYIDAETGATVHPNEVKAATDMGRRIRGTVTPRARATDPDTSRKAARTVKNIGETHKAILKILGNHPESDSEIMRQYAYLRHVHDWPLTSSSGLRTRRKELVDLGRVRDSGRREKLSTGRSGIVWELAQ